jgi:hypothetical protein
MKYICSRCSKQFNQKIHLYNHQNRKIKCQEKIETNNKDIPNLDNINSAHKNEQFTQKNEEKIVNKCNNCLKTFSRKFNYERHLKTCGATNKSVEHLEKIYNELLEKFKIQNDKIAKLEKDNEKILKLENENKEIKEKLLKTKINTTINSNNNNNNTNTNYINIVAFGFHFVPFRYAQRLCRYYFVIAKHNFVLNYVLFCL